VHPVLQSRHSLLETTLTSAPLVAHGEQPARLACLGHAAAKASGVAHRISIGRGPLIVMGRQTSAARIAGFQCGSGQTAAPRLFHGPGRPNLFNGIKPSPVRQMCRTRRHLCCR
jgi:hypothetical protein